MATRGMAGVYRSLVASRMIRITDDRYSHVYLEQPLSKSTGEHESGARVKGDTQPVYKLKPNTGRLRRGKSK